MLRLADARYIVHDGYPILEVEVEGRIARIEPPRKPAFHRAGLVMLGDGFEDLLPPRIIDPDGDGVHRQEVLGLSDDRRLFALVDAFALAVNSDDYREGPVPIPD